MAEYAFDIYPANDPFGKISTTDSRLVRMTVADQLEDAEFWPSLYGYGKGYLEIHGDHPDAQHLQRRGYVAVVRIDTDPDRYIGGFFLDEGDFKALSRQEQRGRVLHFGGAGGASYFDRYRLINFVYAPGQTNRGSYNVPGKWTWDNISPGGILVRLLEEGFNAPAPAPYAAFNWEFTRSVDSNGNPWLETGDYQVDIGTGGSQVLADQIKRGLIVQVGYSLDVTAYRDISEFRTDRTSATFAAGKVRFEAGVNILNDLPKRVAAKRERTHVLMRGKEGNYVLVDEDTELNPVNLGEPYYDFLQDDTTSNVSTLTRKGQVYLERLRDTSDQCEVEHLIGPGGADGEEGYDPGPDGDYWLGDLVTVHTGTADFDYDEQPIEVASIRYFLRDGQWVARASLGAQYTDSRSLGAVQSSAISTIIQQIRTEIPLCQATVFPDAAGIVLESEQYYNSVGGGAEITGLLPTGYDNGNYVAIAHGYFNGSPGTEDGIPDPPSGWTAIGSGGYTGGISGVGQHGAFRVLQPGDTSIGTWVEPMTGVKLMIFSGMDTSDPIGTIAAVTTPSGQISWTTLTPEVTDGTSRFLMIGTHQNENIQDNAVTGTEAVEIVGGSADGKHALWITDGETAWGTHTINCATDDRTGTTYELRAAATGTVIPGAGREELVGTSTRVKRCDDTEHWHEVGSGSPTVNDDEDAGFRVGTLWINDDGAAWLALSVAAGAADWLQLSGGADLSGINFLVGTASGLLSAEIAVGTTPGGELGGTWASPTVDATHSGSAHHTEDHAARHQNGGADEISIAGLDGTPVELTNHLSDATDAHDASAISIVDAGGLITATEVEGALQEIAGASAAAHIADATDAHDASAISVLDTGGNFVGTDVEAVLAELDAAIGGGGHSEDHDHDGTPTQKLIQANTHESPDTDSGPTSLHHTLGTGANQSAAGNHSHSGGIATGTSFPGSPSTDDLFYRTDRDLLYFYDGTRWLTVAQYDLGVGMQEGAQPLAATATLHRWPVRSDFGLYLVRWAAVTFQTNGTPASNNMTVVLARVTAGNVATTIASFQTNADTASNWVRHDQAINAVLDASGLVLRTVATEAGTVTGFICAESIIYRLVG